MQARNPKKWLKQTGQASIEYILVSILAVFILIKPDDQGDVPIVKLANALKTYYHGYGYEYGDVHLLGCRSSQGFYDGGELAIGCDELLLDSDLDLD